MLTILQTVLIVFAGFIGWLLGYWIYTAIQWNKLEKQAHRFVLLNLQRQNEELNKILEDIRKEIK